MTNSSVSNNSAAPASRLGFEEVANKASAEILAQRRELTSAAKVVNASGTLGANRELTYAIDPATQRLVTKVINTDTKEVVMQLPAEYILRLAEDLRRGY